MIKVLAFLLIPALVVSDDILEVIECEASFGDHVIPSPEFCDRYVVCQGNGFKAIKTCPSNENLNIVTSKCAAADQVTCGERTRSWRQEHHGSEERVSDDESNYDFHGDENLNDCEKESKDNNSNQAESGDFHENHEEGNQGEANSSGQKTSHRQTVHNDPLEDVECEEDEEDYVVPDPTHCDRYLVCPSTNQKPAEDLSTNQKPAEDLSTNQKRAQDLSTNHVEICERGRHWTRRPGIAGPGRGWTAGPGTSTSGITSGKWRPG